MKWFLKHDPSLIYEFLMLTAGICKGKKKAVVSFASLKLSRGLETSSKLLQNSACNEELAWWNSVM